jgi:hypothetical protein
MFISQKPVFWAFYSPSFLTHSSHAFRLLLVTPKFVSANKINKRLIFVLLQRFFDTTNQYLSNGLQHKFRSGLVLTDPLLSQPKRLLVAEKVFTPRVCN